MKMNPAVRPFVFAALMLTVLLSVVNTSFAEVAVGISVRFGPPALPVYAQPVCPGPGYFWTPGYWAWSDEVGYYWVPGTWVVAPVGMFWTPGYWGWGNGFYIWHAGYWGRHVGFYGGINYGYGYGGVGFHGGEWRGRSFYYNRSVTNVNVTNVTNVYNKTVIVNNTTVNRVSYNGGNGGVMARPTRQELAAEREPHREALAAQQQHEQSAGRNRQLFASENHGRPAIAATTRPGEFRGRNVVAARAEGAPYHAPAISPREARGPSTNLNRPGNAPSGQGNTNSNSGFRKFGGASNSQNSASSRPGNVNNSNPRDWNTNVKRPANSGDGKQSVKGNSGFQKFGQPPGVPHNSSRPQHVENTARTQSQPHAAPQPHQNAPQKRDSQKQPRDNHNREAERRPPNGR
ncbi:MAG: YXWGXW repeat-containing protein [Acidobacteriia bacterium]|nr:YXWGXW repeat-containing protein [Terriglobia bacterium]